MDYEKVAARMLELEAEVGDDPRDEVPMGEVMASLLGIEPSPEFEAAVLKEMTRARHLASAHYAPLVGKPSDSPGVLVGVGFLQGVTFARAALDVRGR